MADNALTVLTAAGATATLRSIDLGSGVQAQVVLIHEGRELTPVLTGATLRHTVTTSAVVPLVPPAAVARQARVRVYETTGPASPTKRLYYRSDGTSPVATGSNAMGFLLHGEMIVVKLVTFENFVMIAESGSTFEVYVEYLTVAAS